MTPPKLSIRAFSNDQYILDKVFYSNCYKIKGYSNEYKPTIIDIGAHCGYFAFTALALGAGKIYCFEPYVGNYQMLLGNLCTNPAPNINVFQLGVYTKNITLYLKNPTIGVTTYFDFADFKLGDLNDNSYPIECVSLNTVLSAYVKEEVIDILKISIGYAERQILTEADLSKVLNVCGEIDNDPTVFNTFKNDMADKGFIHFEYLPVGEDSRLSFVCSRTNLQDTFVLKE